MGLEDNSILEELRKLHPELEFELEIGFDKVGKGFVKEKVGGMYVVTVDSPYIESENVECRDAITKSVFPAKFIEDKGLGANSPNNYFFLILYTDANSKEMLEFVKVPYPPGRQA